MKLLRLATFVACAAGATMAEGGRDRFVRVAELLVDPAQADAFAAAARQVGQASVRSEDGSSRGGSWEFDAMAEL